MPYVIDDFDTGARFVAAVGEAGDALGHHPRVSIGGGYVDLKLVSDDAIYRVDEDEAPRQRFHVEVYVAPEVAEQRIAAAVAAGGTVVDDSDAPSLTVIADQDGNRGVLCVDTSAAPKG
jgi:hypothetical protein